MGDREVTPVISAVSYGEEKAKEKLEVNNSSH